MNELQLIVLDCAATDLLALTKRLAEADRDGVTLAGGEIKALFSACCDAHKKVYAVVKSAAST